MTSVSRLQRVLFGMGALLVMASPVDAQAKIPQHLPALTESFTVIGDGSSYTTINVARRLDFRGSPSPEMQILHPDKLEGVVLIRVMPGTSAPGVAILGLHGVKSFLSVFNFFGTDNGNQISGTPIFVKRILEPGTYRLFLLSHGENSVIIKFPGARPGSTKVVANISTRYTKQETRGVGTPGTLVVPAITAATTFTAQTRLLQLGFAYLKTSSVVTRFHACVTENPDITDQTLSATPYCLAMAGINNPQPGVNRVDAYQAFYQPPPGTWQFKNFVTGAGIMVDGEVVSLQIELGLGYPLG